MRTVGRIGRNFPRLVETQEEGRVRHWAERTHVRVSLLDVSADDRQEVGLSERRIYRTHLPRGPVLAERVLRDVTGQGGENVAPPDSQG